MEEKPIKGNIFGPEYEYREFCSTIINEDGSITFTGGFDLSFVVAACPLSDTEEE